jgi:LAO/AO transport system kinase
MRCSMRCCPPAAVRCAWASAACPAWARAPSSKRWACPHRAGHRVAVLAVDPVVQRQRRLHPGRQDAHGAPVGAGTRLHPPQPGSGTLGGVAEKTREAMLVCEAAGLRRGDRRDRGRGPERDRRGRHDRHVRAAAAAQRGRRPAGHQEGRDGTGRPGGHQQGRLDEAAATRARAQITSALRLLGPHARMHHAGAAAQRAAAARWAGLADFWKAVQDFRARSRPAAGWRSAASSRTRPGCGNASTPACASASEAHPAVRAGAAGADRRRALAGRVARRWPRAGCWTCCH